MENKSTQREIAISQLQTRFFGQIYSGATLSKCKFTNAHSESVLEWLNSGKGMMVLAGPPGCGKSYFCASVIDWIYGKVLDFYAHSEADFISRVKSSFQLKGDSDDEARYQIDHQFYIFDDLGSTGHQGDKENDDVSWKQKMWFIVIDERKCSNLPTIITTNYSRKQIKEKVGERAYSRLYAQDNCIIEMHGYPDLRKPLSWRETDPDLKIKIT